MGETSQTAPADWYSGESRWRQERAGVFARSWHFLGHASAWPGPSSYVAETLAGYPIVVVRDGSGGFRGFHNVCRHRAGPLTDTASGVCEKSELVCRYHGWRYALDGRLKTARDFGAAGDFDVRDFSLFPVRVESWRGLVFAALDEKAGALGDLLAPLDRALGESDWSGHHIAGTRRHHLKCNWKTYVENYLEGYHIPILHPGLDAELDTPRYSVRVEGRVIWNDAPAKVKDAIYGGFFAWVWPNIAFNVYQTGLMIERMSPIGGEGTRLDYLYLMPPGHELSVETLALSDAVANEDKWIVERVQENLNAGVYARGRLSPKHESGVGAFQAMVRAALDRLD
ncbi:MAG: Rieske 2Fe-2S domain-containing protein [Hyphomonadaceae bacterium]|nr:Rieske 2Fe-2S domain-containing protein [Hyphomonadaceae bacterium]